MISIHKLEAEIFGFVFSNRVFELSDVDSGDSVAQIQLHPEHLPDWLSDEGDTCYISIRLEYDHGAMLDHYSEVEIEEKREQFRERMDEMEE
ncbi:hypothetical protein [Natrinema sp. 74]|uniref:hypothetical protein n=1 Tax=Natrinema sp. 74 TaxID=3384159 RepID=UPI0038D44D4B